MGIYNRDYTQSGAGGKFGNAPQMRMSFPKLTPVVKWLLIVNLAAYVLQSIGLNSSLMQGFCVSPEGWYAGQIWRLISYQFLHGSVFHLLGNMLGVFFLGPTLERHFGSKKFLKFYLGCGASGGVLYIILAKIGWLSAGPMIGASGAVLGMLAACAILFPQFVVFIFLFPVPIRVAAVFVIIAASFVVLKDGHNAGGEAAHLGGILAGGAYILLPKHRAKIKFATKAKRHEKNMKNHMALQAEVDRILEKVRNSGLHSLTKKEQKTLKIATKLQQQ